MTIRLSQLLILVTGFVAAAAVAQASGVVSVHGKLTSITATEYVVETPKSSYYIAKSALTPAQIEKLDRTEIDVKFDVPFEAIDKVKRKEAKK